MNYENTLSSLNKLIGKPIHETDPNDFARHLMNESDRSSIILCGSAVEDFVRVALNGNLTSLNNDETKQLFRFEGPLGTFANKVKLAHGMGLIDRGTRKRLEVIKAMRNAAAHCLDPVSFDSDPFKSGITLLAESKNRQTVGEFSRMQLKLFFEMTCMDLGRLIFDEPLETETKIMTYARSIAPK